jgi:hypothetical protein
VTCVTRVEEAVEGAMSCADAVAGRLRLAGTPPTAHEIAGSLLIKPQDGSGDKIRVTFVHPPSWPEDDFIEHPAPPALQ